MVVAGKWLATGILRDYKLVKTVTGKELTQLRYRTPFSKLPVHSEEEYQVISWNQVSDKEGTGVVHLAPGCGPDDYELLKEFNLNLLSPLDEDGYYNEGYAELAGLHYQQVQDLVSDKLRKRDLLFKMETYRHRYPHCWRCKSELVYRMVEEWFISVDEIRPQLLVAAEQVKWDPDYTRKVFVDWINNMDDWCISRKRYWGLPLPFYECPCGHLTVVKSKHEFLTNAQGPVEEVRELHRPWLDKVKYPCENCAKPLDRVSEVGDCWLDAGIMPFSTLGYFESDKKWEEWFPADFVCEMREQVRLWFYSMMFLSVTLVGQPPFTHLLSHEMVRDRNNDEMHKSGENNVLLDDAMENLGADTLRLYFLSQNRSSNMRFDFEVDNQLNKLLMTLYHSFRFFQTYADLETFVFDPSKVSDQMMDTWMLSRLDTLTREYMRSLQSYDYSNVVGVLQEVVDDLSSWYLRRVRNRVWNRSSKIQEYIVYNTLFRVFHQMAVLFAPITPFFSEVIHQNLRYYYPQLQESVHLERLRKLNWSDLEVELAMNVARKLEEMNRQLRNKEGVKLRQPLRKAFVWDQFLDYFSDDMLKVVQEILNVKEIEYIRNPQDYVQYSLIPNYNVAGPKYGSVVVELKSLLRQMEPSHAANVALGETSDFTVGSYNLTKEDVEVRMKPVPGLQMLTSKNTVLLLDMKLDQELSNEGWLREFTRYVQLERKQQNLEVEQKVDLFVNTSEKLQKRLNNSRNLLMEQLVLNSLQFTKSSEEDYTSFQSFDGKVRFKVVSQLTQRSAE